MIERSQKLRRPARSRPRRGSILVIAMWVVVVLGALVVVYARSMQVEGVASANRLSNVKAVAIEHAAEQYVLCNVDGTMGDAVSMTAIPGQAIQVGDGYFWLLRPNPADDQHFDFGIQDEASKLNLNIATDAMLVNVPNANQEIADAIMTWKNASGTPTGQAEGSSYYESLPEPYDNKSNNFETVEELLLLQDMTDGAQTIPPDVLFGSDLNRNGIIDNGEGGTGTASSSLSNSLNNSAGNYTDSRGMYNFLTCYTAEPNTDPNGNAKINVNLPTARDQLQTLMLQTLSQSRVTEVLGRIAGTGNQRTYANLGAWYTASGLQPQEFGPIAMFLTASRSNASTTKGLVNVNTASEQVLMALGLQQSDADSIISSRGSNTGGINTTSGSGVTMGSSTSTAPSGDMTWLFTAIPQSAATIIPYITYRSFQYSADIVAVSGDGRSFRRVRIVVDASTSPPVIVYRKDLTAYGWPLTADASQGRPDIRQALRSGQPPPVIQTTNLTSGNGL